MLWQLILMELRTFYRNPGILFWAFGFPILIAGILGMAFSGKEDSLRKIGVVGENNLVLVEEYKRKKIPDHSYSEFHFIPLTEKEAILKMKRAEIHLYLKRETDTIQYFFDPGSSDSFQSYLLLDRMESAGSEVKSEINPISAKGSRYIDFLVPGLLAMGIMNSCLWGSGWMLIEFRMKKLMRRMMASPLPKHIFLISHMFSRLLLSGGEFVILIVFSHFFFDLNVQGSYLALLIAFLSGNFLFSGVAILVSSRTKSTQVANGLINLVSFPMTVSSGIFFSYHNFPESAEKVIQYFPLTVMADVIRSIFNEGTGLYENFFPLLGMNLVGLILFGIGVKIYRWD